MGGAPFLCHLAMGSDSNSSSLILPLATFYGASALAITFYGGIFSVLPAYIAELWGPKHAGAIHGKLLTAWAASAICGPIGLSFLRAKAVDNAIADLLPRVGDDIFEQTFDCKIENAQHLIDAKTVTIARLIEIAPTGTIDPTPFLYDNACYAAAVMMSLSAFANIAIRPIDPTSLVAHTTGKEKVEKE